MGGDGSSAAHFFVRVLDGLFARARRAGTMGGNEQGVRAVYVVLMETLAKLAGLEQALADYPEDVAAAFRQASGHRDVMRAPEAPEAEPWPPMKAGDGL